MGKGESRATFEDSGTDWHIYSALKGLLDGKKEPFLASCRLGLGHLLCLAASTPRPSVLSGSRCEDLRLFLLPAVAKGGGKGPLSSMLSQAVWGEGMKRDFQHV